MTAAIIQEERRVRRRQVHIPAKIQIGREAPMRDCVVVDISQYGARIAMEDAAEAPDKFVITLTPRGYPYRRCHVRWRSASEVGVEFDRPLNARHVHDPAHSPQPAT